MPRGDKTGPRGLGARTGRGLGYCSGYSTPGCTKGSSMGMGMGRGGGRDNTWRRGGGRRRGVSYRLYPYQLSGVIPPYSPHIVSPTILDPEEESKYLEETLANLKTEIKRIEKRLEELVHEK